MSRILLALCVLGVAFNSFVIATSIARPGVVNAPASSLRTTRPDLNSVFVDAVALKAPAFTAPEREKLRVAALARMNAGAPR